MRDLIDASRLNAFANNEGSTGNRASLLSNTWTQGDGVTGANFQGSGGSASVFHYEETAGGSDPQEGWAAVNDLTSPTDQSGIDAQEGLAVYLFQDRDFDGSDEGFPITRAATGSAPAHANDGTDVTVPVTCTDNDGSSAGLDGCTDPNDGWNLVANPFVSHVDWSSSGFTKSGLQQDAYVYDADNGHYDLTSGTNDGDEFIAPFQAFFVKSNAADYHLLASEIDGRGGTYLHPSNLQRSNAMTYAPRLAVILAVLVGVAATSVSAQTPAATVKNGSPNVVLQSFTGGGLLAPDQGASSGDIPAENAGTRLMWYPGKAALRAGGVNGSQWDDVNIGIWSVAFGRDTKASGKYATAVGYYTSASNYAATAMGDGTTASNYAATAMGSGTTASGF